MSGLVRGAISFALLLFVAIVFPLEPAWARQDCHAYCSGPGKSYDSCMKQCIGRKEEFGGRGVGRDIEALCSSRGHDYDTCMREQHQQRRDRDYAPPPQDYYPPPRDRCWYDDYGRRVCR